MVFGWRAGERHLLAAAQGGDGLSQPEAAVLTWELLAAALRAAAAALGLARLFGTHQNLPQHQLGMPGMASPVLNEEMFPCGY